MGWGNKSEYKWFMSHDHDQDSRHVHKWLTPLKIFFSRPKKPTTLKLGLLEYYQIYSNADPGLTLCYFTAGQIWSNVCENN